MGGVYFLFPVRDGGPGSEQSPSGYYSAVVCTASVVVQYRSVHASERGVVCESLATLLR